MSTEILKSRCKPKHCNKRNNLQDGKRKKAIKEEYYNIDECI